MCKHRYIVDVRPAIIKSGSYSTTPQNHNKSWFYCHAKNNKSPRISGFAPPYLLLQNAYSMSHSYDFIMKVMITKLSDKVYTYLHN